MTETPVLARLLDHERFEYRGMEWTRVNTCLTRTTFLSGLFLAHFTRLPETGRVTQTYLRWEAQGLNLEVIAGTLDETMSALASGVRKVLASDPNQGIRILLEDALQRLEGRSPARPELRKTPFVWNEHCFEPTENGGFVCGTLSIEHVDGLYQAKWACPPYGTISATVGRSTPEAALDSIRSALSGYVHDRVLPERADVIRQRLISKTLDWIGAPVDRAHRTHNHLVLTRAGHKVDVLREARTELARFLEAANDQEPLKGLLLEAKLAQRSYLAFEVLYATENVMLTTFTRRELYVNAKAPRAALSMIDQMLEGHS